MSPLSFIPSVRLFLILSVSLFPSKQNWQNILNKHSHTHTPANMSVSGHAGYIKTFTLVFGIRLHVWGALQRLRYLEYVTRRRKRKKCVLKGKQNSRVSGKKSVSCKNSHVLYTPHTYMRKYIYAQTHTPGSLCALMLILAFGCL